MNWTVVAGLLFGIVVGVVVLVAITFIGTDSIMKEIREKGEAERKRREEWTRKRREGEEAAAEALRKSKEKP